MSGSWHFCMRVGERWRKSTGRRPGSLISGCRDGGGPVRGSEAEAASDRVDRSVTRSYPASALTSSRPISISAPPSPDRCGRTRSSALSGRRSSTSEGRRASGTSSRARPCFAAELDPRARVADLTDAQLEEVIAAARDHVRRRGRGQGRARRLSAGRASMHLLRHSDRRRRPGRRESQHVLVPALPGLRARVGGGRQRRPPPSRQATRSRFGRSRQRFRNCAPLGPQHPRDGRRWPCPIHLRRTLPAAASSISLLAASALLASTMTRSGRIRQQAGADQRPVDPGLLEKAGNAIAFQEPLDHLRLRPIGHEGGLDEIGAVRPWR